MQEFKKITTSEVTEKLTMGQIERIWQQIDAKKEHDPNSLSLRFSGLQALRFGW